MATWTIFSDFPTLEQEVANDKAYKFSGLELQDLLVVEVCAGTARAYKDHPGTWNHGGPAIDKSHDRSCGTEIMILDLTVEHDLNLLHKL